MTLIANEESRRPIQELTDAQLAKRYYFVCVCNIVDEYTLDEILSEIDVRTQNLNYKGVFIDELS